jgi:nitrite reductase (NO-forming)
MPEDMMASTVNRSSESSPLEDAGLIRRNWRVGLRLIFGLFWAADAYLKWSLIWQGVDYRDLFSSAAVGQPSIASSWIKFWASIAGSTPGFAYVIAIVETLIAIFIIVGLFTKLTSLAGIVFSFLIWSTAEAFGGVFTQGATDIGTAPLYMAMFAGLIVVRAGMQRGLDRRILSRCPRLRLLL